MDFTRLTSIPLREPSAVEESEEMNLVRDAVAVLDAISFGELFAALPANSGDCARHQSGIVLLELLSRRLKDSLKADDF